MRAGLTTYSSRVCGKTQDEHGDVFSTEVGKSLKLGRSTGRQALDILSGCFQTHECALVGTCVDKGRVEGSCDMLLCVINAAGDCQLNVMLEWLQEFKESLVDTIPPETSSNDFGGFGINQQIRIRFSSLRNFFFGTIRIFGVQSPITCNETVHVHVLWPVCTHTIPFRMVP